MTRGAADPTFVPARGDVDRRGLGYGVGAYALWGVLPLYFPLLRPSGAVEILAHRVVWSAVVCVLLIVTLRRADRVWLAIRTPRTLMLMAGAAGLVGVNWGVFVYAVNSGNVVQASFGYYINPLVTVFLGVVVLGERLRRLQWGAVVIGAMAVAAMAVDFGRLPWIALTLAGTFATYGLLKNFVGRGVDALSGLTVETILLAPLAAVFLVWWQFTGQSSLWAADASGAAPLGTTGLHLLALSCAGVITVVPLLLFAAAARRIPLSMVGLLQYIAPTLQFLIGVTFLGEPMSSGRWIAFGLVWLAVSLLAFSTVRFALSRPQQR